MPKIIRERDRIPYAEGMASFAYDSTLADTGSNILPWLIIAGVIVVLGIVALVVSSVVRGRRAAGRVEDAAAAEAVAGSTTGAPETPVEPDTSGEAGPISPDDPR